MINVNPPAAKTVARTDPGHPFRDHPFRCRRGFPRVLYSVQDPNLWNSLSVLGTGLGSHE
jgi:hypothetical protein